MNKNIRIALLGGTFDPVHNGHLYVARHLRQKLGFDEVHLVTAYKPPHKQSNVLDAVLRHEMVTLACQNEEGIVASSLEIDNHYSYTIETVRHMLAHPEQFGAAAEDTLEISFITSAEYMDPDYAHNILHWKDAAELLSLIDLVVTTRGENGAQRTREWVERLGLKRAFVEDIPPIPVTSGMVKKALGVTESIDGLVPAQVAGFIHQRGIYRP